MKNYIVGYLSFFENDLKLFRVIAKSDYEAIREAMINACTTDECRQSEIDWQDSKDYPQDLESLLDMLYNSDIVVNVIEI